MPKLSLSTLCLFAMSCAPTSVGDPCIPEGLPSGGFSRAESYFELSSAQCETRLCLAHGLSGNPRRVVGTASCPSGATDCVTEAELEQTTYCTCRCDGPAGAPRCECPDGFVCEELNRIGNGGVTGSYCVRE